MLLNNVMRSIWLFQYYHKSAQVARIINWNQPMRLEDDLSELL
jgi:hypothetical protein